MPTQVQIQEFRVFQRCLGLPGAWYVHLPHCQEEIADAWQGIVEIPRCSTHHRAHYRLQFGGKTMDYTWCSAGRAQQGNIEGKRKLCSGP
jgi:hypothetical protein